MTAFYRRLIPGLVLCCVVVNLRAALPLPSDTLPLAAVLAEPVMLETTNGARVFSDRQLRSFLGQVAPRTPVRLLAWSPEVFYVTARGTRGSMLTGWIAPSAVSPVDERILDEAEQRQKLQEDIEEAIRNRDVILGMSADDVQRSLGRPQSRGRSRDRTGERETWTYIKYESVPQVRTVIGPDGCAYQTTVNVRVPVGRTLVHFENGVVEAFEDVPDADRGASLGTGVPVVVPTVRPWPQPLPRTGPAPGTSTNRARFSR